MSAYTLSMHHAAQDSAYDRLLEAERRHEVAIERLHTAVEKCGNDPDKLADLLIAVMGDKKAAEVISDYLLGDSDALNARVVGWAS